eukprot:TRINITY_DN1065_c0_g1_i1.p1 TRINITY_DN1065_c0_g1~~TRINITY_DN1065_c0_g1_i1.p1  ORF type:complete len:340 (-),score=128.77 TRINITY_DN1065_c0_g1_i1:116-1090(-)
MWKGASFFDLLKNTPVASIPHKDITVIDSNETPINGFELLLKNKIQSAPVFDKAAGKFIGFLDIRDLISYTVFAFQNRDKVAYNSGTAGDVAVAQQSINHIVYAFKLVENVSTPYLARRNAFCAVSESGSLWDVAVLLAKGCHRVPIVTAEGKVISLISQSNLIRLFAANLAHSLKDETSFKVRDIEVGTSPVLSVSRDTSAIDAFIKLDNAKRTGLAVLDVSGKLLGNISGRDLTLFVGKSFSYDVLEESVLSFLNKVRANNVNDDCAVSISCTLDDTLATVISKLAATGIHRIYITNADYTLARIISLTDVLRAVLIPHSIK